MIRFLAAALTLVGLVFAAGCVGAPESEGAGGGAAESAPAKEAQGTPPTAPRAICAPDSCGYKCLKIPGKILPECRCLEGEDCYW